jgi:hypothetical protein
MVKLKKLEFIYHVELDVFPRAFRGINITIGAKSPHTYFEQTFLSKKKTYKRQKKKIFFCHSLSLLSFPSYSSYSQGVMEIYYTDSRFQ